MEGFVLFILIIIVSQIIGAIKGGTRQPPGGQPGPQRQRPGIERRPGAQVPAPPQARTTEVDAAADMIPPELWELLRGEPHPSRARTAPPQMPESLEADTEEEEQEQQVFRETRTEAEDVDSYVRARTRDVSGDIEAVLAQQRAIVEERSAERAPHVVSLETEPLSASERHRAFHVRVDRVEAAPAPVVSSLHGLGLRTRADLRRAFVLKEILGSPKALEEEGLDR
jgi:hypothetical protein